MNKLNREMRTWGDVALVLNGFVRNREIAGFQTNRGSKSAKPKIEVHPLTDQTEAEAVDLVRAALTGSFAKATITVALPS